jgi:hypothetical protein
MLKYLGSLAAAPLVRGFGRPLGPTIIPFTMYGRRGELALSYGVTSDPVAVGFDVVTPRGFDVASCRGYPTIEGTIERYDGSGYRMLCGWIQVVTGTYYRSADATEAPVETTRSVDKLPSMEDVDLPFAALGPSPKHFDAPCRNLNGHAKLHWVADAFLTTVPIRSKDEPIHRALGFRWGYEEFEDTAHRPVSPLPLTVTGPESWNALLPFLKTSYPHWTFASAD